MLHFVIKCKEVGALDKIVVKVELRSEEAQKFLALKKHFGVNKRAEVIRILLNKAYEEITHGEAQGTP